MAESSVGLKPLGFFLPPPAPISAHCVEFEIPGTQEDNVGLGEDSEWYQYGIVNGISIPDNWKTEGLTR